MQICLQFLTYCLQLIPKQFLFLVKMRLRLIVTTRLIVVAQRRYDLLSPKSL